MDGMDGMGRDARVRKRDNCLKCWPGSWTAPRPHRLMFGRRCASVVSEEAVPWPRSERVGYKQDIGFVTYDHTDLDVLS